MRNHIEDVKGLIADLQRGEPSTSGALTLVPLFGARPGPDYLLAGEAVGAGLLMIEEMGDGDVPQLLADNKGEHPVLIVDGEHLEGAKQNRILNVSVLLAAGHKTVLPVSCVEQGRWHYQGGQRDFSSSDDHSYARLRKLQAEAGTRVMAGKRARPSQGEVWQEVAAKHREMNVANSPSGAMKDAFMQHRGELDAMRATFAAPQAEQTGVIAFVSGHPVAMDLFDRPDTLTKMWSRLVSGYSMDALGVPANGGWEKGATFLRYVAEAPATMHEGLGLGMDVTFASDHIVGNALTHEGGVIHMALFPRSEQRTPPRGPGRSAAQRRGSYFHQD
ncbi:MAG: ARPP-1 family domain-containing protein [Actinomycetota bacterium]